MFVRTLSAALLSFPLLVSAATYSKIDTAESQVQFHYQQMGVKMDGVFKGISGDISFDTADAENAKVSLSVNTESADTGSDDANAEIVKAEWFNSAQYPDAVFTAQSIVAKAANEFEVTGLLTIKGHEQEVKFPATLVEENNRAVFTGSLALLRGDYAIGEGSWAKFDLVANEIRVDFTIVATN